MVVTFPVVAAPHVRECVCVAVKFAEEVIYS